jgi:hypothetical protein
MRYVKPLWRKRLSIREYYPRGRSPDSATVLLAVPLIVLLAWLFGLLVWSTLG